MKTVKENSEYVKRLSETAREKSLLGYEQEAAEYFIKAIKLASSAEDFVLISWDIYRSDLTGNKALAYSTFIRSLESAEYSVKQFRKALLREDLVSMISEFLIKMPDHLFHFLLSRAQNKQDEKIIAEIFEPLSLYISDPDPSDILTTLRRAS